MRLVTTAAAAAGLRWMLRGGAGQQLVAYVSVGLVLAAWAAWLPEHGARPFPPAWVAGGFLAFLGLMAIPIYILRRDGALLRHLLLAAAVAACAGLAALGGRAGAVPAALLLPLVLDFGWRYGAGAAWRALGLVLAALAVVFILGPEWRAQWPVAAALWLAVAAGGAFGALFATRHARLRHRLEQAHARLDEAERARAEFLAHTSQELRTPLSSVLSACELLRETELGVPQREYVEAIHGSAHALMDIVTNVLDVSRLDAGEAAMRHVCFDLHECVNAAVETLQPLAEQKGLSVHANVSRNTPRFVYGDPARLRQVLVNLGSGAVRNTQHGHVSLHTYASAVVETSAHVCFEVIDTGSGDAGGRYGDEGGLGAALARQLVALMGGRLSTSSVPGRGNRYWFELDLTLAVEQDRSHVDADVLILSTNRGHVRTWQTLLSSWEMQTAVVDSVVACLDVVEAWRDTARPRTILVDDSSISTPPIRVAQLIREAGGARLRLLLSTMNPRLKENPAVRECFHEVLDVPVDSRQLYHALKAEAVPTQAAGVIPLPARYSQRQAQTPEPLNILVAEDQETNQFVFRRILESEGHCVTLARDGRQALDLLESEIFDLAILDLHMPEMDGLEVIKLFKFMEPDSRMPFAIVTANARKEVLEDCKDVVDAFLTKPVQKRHLLDVVNRLTRNRRLTEAPTPAAGPLAAARHEPLLDQQELDMLMETAFDEPFLNELFAVFRVNASELLVRLEQALGERRDLGQARTAAHSIKGIAADVSAKRLEAMARQCERMILTDPRLEEKVEAMLEELTTCLRETEAEMTAYLTRLRSQNR